MNLKSIIIATTALICLVAGTVFPQGDPVEKEKAILDSVLKFLELLHIEPKDINDDFSKTLHSEYLDNLDPGKRFLLQDEVAQLDQFELNIDDQINQRSFEYFNMSVELLEKAIERGGRYF